MKDCKLAAIRDMFVKAEQVRPNTNKFDSGALSPVNMQKGDGSL
jgi:hypothetical protein